MNLDLIALYVIPAVKLLLSAALHSQKIAGSRPDEVN
jgi:hypothetical protein